MLGESVDLKSSKVKHHFKMLPRRLNFEEEPNKSNMGTTESKSESIEIKEEPMVSDDYDILYPSAQKSFADSQWDLEKEEEKEKKTKREEEKKEVKKNTNFRNGMVEKRFKCIVCDRPYVYKGHMYRHVRARHAICIAADPIQCNVCGRHFSDLTTFDEHKKHSETRMKMSFEKMDLSDEQERDIVDMIRQNKLVETKSQL